MRVWEPIGQVQRVLDCIEVFGQQFERNDAVVSSTLSGSYLTQAWYLSVGFGVFFGDIAEIEIFIGSANHAGRAHQVRKIGGPGSRRKGNNASLSWRDPAHG